MTVAILDDLFHAAKQDPQLIAIPEADNETMMRAAAEAAELGYARIVLVGDEQKLRLLCKERGIDASLFAFLSCTDENRLTDIAARYEELEGTLLRGKALMRRMTADPLMLALAAEAVDDVDSVLAGIDRSTGEVIMAGQMLVGMQPGIETVSSVAVGEVPGATFGEGGCIAFGDCAVTVRPSASELADIAITSCGTVADLMGWDPKCALLSFSTCGSGANEVSEVVAAAAQIAREKRPDLAIDGEFQLDAALIPEVATHKVPRESAVAGQANIVIFPELNAGNIGVKIMQRFARVDAVGPFLQGFRKIVCDCSRSANQAELVGNIAVASVRASRLKARTVA